MITEPFVGHEACLDREHTKVYADVLSQLEITVHHRPTSIV